MTEKPLVTFALFAYNQAAFVSEAARAALAQTYAPLEVILSDDASEDATFEIMRSVAESYSGAHRVVLRRNERNLGIGAHVETVMRTTGGEFVVVAAGDDVSLPDRTSWLVQEWLKSNRRAACIFSNMQMIDSSGQPKGPWCGSGTPRSALTLEAALAHKSCWVHGCAAAYTRGVVDLFPPMSAGVIQEDNVLPFRALMIGNILYIDRCLVHYRLHDRNVWAAPGHSRGSGGGRARRIADNRVATVETWIRDLHAANRGELVERFDLNREKWSREVEVSTFAMSRLRALQHIATAWAHGMSSRRALGLVQRRVVRR